MKKRALFVLAAALAIAADLTGTWDLEVVTDQANGTPTLTLKQDGEKLTGKYSGQLGEHAITGTVKGDEFEVGFTSEYGPIKYNGKVAGDSVSGKVDLAGGQAKGTFKGTRRK